MAFIELKGICKEYQSDQIVTNALEDVNLMIEKGSFISIIGASGSGKTTLLNMIGCMDKPTRGQYILDGRKIDNLSESELSKIRGKRIAFVFQNFALIEDNTVYENVELPLLKRGILRSDRRQKVQAALTSVGISDLSRKRPAHISGGQKQRTAIARAIACGAEIILADEPTGALDSTTAKEIMNLLADLNRDGTTIIVITHDMDVAKYAQRIIEIKDGRIKNDGEENN